MVSSRVMSRRKRAQVGTILAILMILLPLPCGAYFVGNLNGYGSQSVVFDLDDVPDDSGYDQDLVTYSNVTGDYTYEKTLSTGTLLANYTSDVVRVNLDYKNSSDVEFASSLSYSETDGKIFFLPAKATGDADSVLEFGTPAGTVRPNVGLVTSISPAELLDAGVDSGRIYFENGQEMNLTVILGVYDKDAVPTTWAGVSDYGINGQVSSTAGNYEIVCLTDVVSSPNGSWIDFEISSTDILTASTLHGDGYITITFVDVDGGVLDPSSAIITDLELYGPDVAFSANSWWHAALIAIGTLGLLGSVIATPFVSLESLSGDGLNGNRYRKGDNPRPKKRRTSKSRSSSRRRN